MVLSKTEENYLKAIYKVAEREQGKVSTNAIASEMSTSAASVTDMLKKLAEKELISYQKYKGVQLTSSGTRYATQLIRKHRLWELFLVDTLGFGWDEVHDVAEELEHIQSDKLILALDEFLGFPKYDPHGDPIPNAQGKFTIRQRQLLSEFELNTPVELVGLKEHDTALLHHLDDLGIGLGTKLSILEKYAYDNSLKVAVGDHENECNLSPQVTEKIYVKHWSGS
jgi:DtxR family Mn-dependent transcriptional regulator